MFFFKLISAPVLISAPTLILEHYSTIRVRINGGSSCLVVHILNAALQKQWWCPCKWIIPSNAWMISSKFVPIAVIIYIPVKSKLQRSPHLGDTPGIWGFFLPGRERIWSPLIGHGNLITSLDVMLRVAPIPRGLINHGGDGRDGRDKLWWIQRKRFHIRGGLVENQRPTQALLCILRCLRPTYIYLWICVWIFENGANVNTATDTFQWNTQDFSFNQPQIVCQHTAHSPTLHVAGWLASGR